jgi:MFS family permease
MSRGLSHRFALRATRLTGSRICSSRVCRRAVKECDAAALNAGAFSAVVYVGTLELQLRLGYRPLQAALALAPLDAVSLLVGAVGGGLLDRRSPRVACAAGFAATAAALAWLARTPAGATYALDLLPALALLGVSLTIVFVVLTGEAVADVAAADRGVASGLFETGTHLGGGAMAVAVYATLIAVGGDRAAFLGAAGLAGAGLLLAVLPTGAGRPARRSTGPSTRGPGRPGPHRPTPAGRRACPAPVSSRLPPSRRASARSVARRSPRAPRARSS